MNVSNSLHVIRMPHASTLLGPTHAPAMKVTLEMEWLALVGVPRYCMLYQNIVWMVVSSESVRATDTGTPVYVMIIYVFVQMLMSAWSSLLVIRMLCVPMHLGPTHVPAMKDTLEMEWLALVCM